MAVRIEPSSLCTGTGRMVNDMRRVGGHRRKDANRVHGRYSVHLQILNARYRHDASDNVYAKPTQNAADKTPNNPQRNQIPTPRTTHPPFEKRQPHYRLSSVATNLTLFRLSLSELSPPLPGLELRMPVPTLPPPPPPLPPDHPPAASVSLTVSTARLCGTSNPSLRTTAAPAPAHPPPP